MKQYNAIKAKYPDALLLFRVGDFYETFGQDAVRAAKVLGIVLTKRANGKASHIELAGFPHHSLETYLPKLVRAGHRVAICDQLEDPKAAKGIVKRGVTELVTPGVSYNDNVLDQRSNNFLCSLHFGDKNIGISFLDISTGEFLITQGNELYIKKLIKNFGPSEILFRKSFRNQFHEVFGDGYCTFTMEDWVYTVQYGSETLKNHFGTKNLKGFGVNHLEEGIVAAGAALQYLADTQHKNTDHIHSLVRIEEERYMWVDGFTAANLELLRPNQADGTCLLDILDHTETPMGSRMMKRWAAFPLKERAPIEQRLDSVDVLIQNPEVRTEIQERLKKLADLERLASKISTGRVNPRELLSLKRSLEQLPSIINQLQNLKTESLTGLISLVNPCTQALDIIANGISEEAPLNLSKGNVIADRFNDELDELRSLAFSGKDKLIEIQKRETEVTGISSLKIGFNNVFGYYLEATNAHKDKIPESWIRKQTLVNSERYITQELKAYEEKILGAEDKIKVLESRLYSEILQKLQPFVISLQQNSNILAQIDCLNSFAVVSEENGYMRPKFSEEQIIHISEGRHPVIEKSLPIGESYVPNDVYLNNKTQQILVITGPNMSGKSALLRQTALISIMAQIGCFVPAKSAELGLIDKVFSRVGASDNLSQGESTFMVEMNEAASILHNMTSKSLVILDEIGRGTSTYDGISIAMAIVEHMHENPKANPNVLFATHYHELNALEAKYDRIKNFNVSVKEVGNKVLFLRKLEPGGTEHSFGIHVAKMAGMPSKVVNRAKEVLSNLEDSNRNSNKSPKSKNTKSVDNLQLSFFQLDDPVLEQIKEEIEGIDIDTLTPVEALLKLHEIKKALGSRK
ncbi:MAG: DNA mismatch repair protein MutS [Flavobacteriales bacterium]|nr:DNA mismatch repair protein MutS [Flavobacteriales bacterium]MCB9191836.1 DNA mismatch repair protein MutS [Flavobacteriales bacterium]MCB9204743.1 DNA mismatch repair protein MutS [Flavobacteriales bacterium]